MLLLINIINNINKCLVEETLTYVINKELLYFMYKVNSIKIFINILFYQLSVISLSIQTTQACN